MTALRFQTVGDVRHLRPPYGGNTQGRDHSIGGDNDGDIDKEKEKDGDRYEQKKKEEEK